MPQHKFRYAHPLFGRGDWLNAADKIKATAKGIRWDRSPYYAWFAALLRNKDYERYCKTKRGAFANLYADWGDVARYANDFKAWFNDGDRGRGLFAEPLLEIDNQRLDGSEPVDWIDARVAVFQLDLSRPKPFLRKRVLAMLDKAHAEYLRQHGDGLSLAKYRFHVPPKDTLAYLRMLQVWDMHEQGIKHMDIHRQVYGAMGDIGQRQLDHERRQSLKGSKEVVDAPAAKHLLQKQAWQEVDRDLKAACKLIANAGRGVFPKTS